MGAKAGTRPDFRYSDPLKTSGIVWTDATLDAWLTKPMAMVKGTKMSFAGMPDATNRNDLIAYIKREAR